MNEVIQKESLDLPQRLIRLGEIARNLWWCWHPEARMLFKMLLATLSMAGGWKGLMAITAGPLARWR